MIVKSVKQDYKMKNLTIKNQRGQMINQNLEKHKFQMMKLKQIRMND